MKTPAGAASRTDHELDRARLTDEKQLPEIKARHPLDERAGLAVKTSGQA